MTKEKIYSQAIWRYGFITLLYIINEHEKNENFEECAIIFNIINNHTERFEMVGCPKYYNDEAVDWLRAEFWKLGHSGDVAIHNIPSYAQDIKDEINSLNK